MLLVDDHEAELPEDDVLLDERMGPYDEPGLPVFQTRLRLILLFGREASHEQVRSNPVDEEQLLDILEMLTGKDLRGDHEGHLDRAFHDRMDRRDERHDGLPGSDIPLQEPLARMMPLHILEDLEGDDLLRIRKRVRDVGDDVLDELGIERDDGGHSSGRILSFLLAFQSFILHPV